LRRSTVTGNLSVVCELLESSANPNLQDCDGESPLHWACFGGSPDLIRFLMDAGANPLLDDHERLSPLEWARTNVISSIVSIIENHSGVRIPKYETIDEADS